MVKVKYKHTDVETQWENVGYFSVPNDTSDKEIIHRAKRLMGLTGVRCYRVASPHPTMLVCLRVVGKPNDRVYIQLRGVA